jgi:NAD(P)H-hydrate epimerase
VAELLRRRPAAHHLVIDADGLFALAEIAGWQRLVDPHVVLTPHAGELERLVGQAPAAERAAWEEAGALAKAWGCVLVAKGPFTSVAGPDGRVQVWPHANPALATGGTGDVLAGICGGLLAQGCQTVDGACLAVGVHALAAERIVRQRQWRTLAASDLLSELPATLWELERDAAAVPNS